MACVFSLSVFMLCQFASVSMARSNADKVLSARFIAEEQYLKQMPPIVESLYGPMAVPALKLLWTNSGPVFAMDAMLRAYGEVWALEGPPSVNERSLATVSALVAQGLYPQIRLHINGFISSGGTLEGLYELVGTAADEAGSPLSSDLVDAVAEGLKWRERSIGGFKAPTREEVQKFLRKGMKGVSQKTPARHRLALLVKFSAQMAIGNMEKTRGFLRDLVQVLPPDINKDRYVDLLITHLIVYCGYPKGMNAFSSWQQIRPEFGMK
jgi:4-carboxymuconolactone decarboxylase